MSGLLHYEEFVPALCLHFCCVMILIHLQNQVSSVAGLDETAGIHPLPGSCCLSANPSYCAPAHYLLHMWS